MLKRASAVRSKATAAAVATPSSVANTKPVVNDNVVPSSYYSSPNNNNQPSSATTTPDDEVIERVRLRISNAHVFKLPPKPTSGGWRGAEWRDKAWQGTLKVVERRGRRQDDQTLVLLVDSRDERNIFAICPIVHDVGHENDHQTTATATNGGSNAGNGVDRCIDSSRYFVLRIRNVRTGRHMYIGLAFNERNDAFDFNTSLEDSRREKEMDHRAAAELLAGEMESLGGVTTNDDDAACGGGGGSGRGVVGGTNYTMNEGEKMHVKIPVLTNNNNNDNDNNDNDDDDNTATESLSPRRRQKITSKNKNKAVSKSSGGGGAFLKPSTKDTPSRLAA